MSNIIDLSALRAARIPNRVLPSENAAPFEPRVTGRRPLITVDPAQKGDMRHTYADTTLARTDLGFEPTVGLEEGLAAEHQWLAGIL